jgi:DNA-binding response OmpR family regulator
VDDEPSAVEIVTRFLEAKGHRVAGAGSAEDAAVALREGKFDLVLLDVVLPGRTGLQALAEFRKLTPSPIYIMSGMSDPESRKDAMLLGASGFFGKPIDFAEVVAAIAALP